MSDLYDISRTIAPTLAVWPGDTPLTIEQNTRLSDGDASNLTTITATPHIGTHTDAPWHTTPDGVHPAAMPLDPFIGPARVVYVDRKQGGIVPADLGGQDLTGVTRLLIRTWYSDVPDEHFLQEFPYPTIELVDWLADQGVRLLGLDIPTVDAFDSAELACHRRLNAHGMVNLELLMLADVPPGDYELIALPLKLDGVCGSPVRAVLRPLP
jgi:arylformamidase